MIHQRIVGYGEHFLLQVFQIVYAHNLLSCLGVDYHEIPEPEMGVHFPSQHLRVGLGAFVDERRIQFLGIRFVCSIARFQNKRDNLSRMFEISSEFIASKRIFLAVVHKTHVGNHAKNVVFVTLIHFHGFFIVSGETYLGSASHAERLQVSVEGFF